ncbi:hypothetical protein M422DRAFT_269630 [Sphaerobolus stellatus SS14]|uniref:Unplaced genomic scaffold SPHSTscaffold_217, whole genome shotgun sequence n=1 Tax=Sphaerobolus stellatus (strain SS14) TaxID=990650 RepID=A0A0C9U472_SPHS4|nr:hypothetical protein M422DRAFT_269630 [Sphaerobolus stellatus SS14]
MTKTATDTRHSGTLWPHFLSEPPPATLSLKDLNNVGTIRQKSLAILRATGPFIWGGGAYKPRLVMKPGHIGVAILADIICVLPVPPGALGYREIASRQIPASGSQTKEE